MTRLARLWDVFEPNVDPERAYFCTYGFDPRFFEAELLPALLPNSVSLDRAAGSESAYLNAADTALQRHDIGVFYDHLFEGQGPELFYGSWPVDVRPRAFHAKLMLLDYGDFVRAVISSANLTAAAWTTNLELFLVEDLERGTPHPWASGLRSFVAQLVQHVPDTHADHRRSLGELLTGIPDSGAGADRVTSTWQESLLPALFDGLDSPTRIDVVTPFFEGVHGEGVFDSIRARAPRITGRLYVSTTTDHGRAQVVGPATKLDELLDSGGWTMHAVRQTWEGDEPGAPARGLHGKALALTHADGARVMVGSANVTRAALIGTARSAAHGGQSNVEIVVLRDTTVSDARGVLPQADLLNRGEVDFIDRTDGEEEDVVLGPERYVLESTYYGREGELQIIVVADAPPLSFRYEDKLLFHEGAAMRRAPVALGVARYVVVDDGSATGIVPFTVVDAHLLVPRGSRPTIGLEDFLDVLAGGRELPLRPSEDFAARAGVGVPAVDDLVGRRGPIPWRRFLAAVRGLGQEIERERPFERGLQHALESPIRLKGLRDHLELARTSGRLTDADLLYALYELSRELRRIRDAEDQAAGRELIQAACADLDARRAELAANVPSEVAAQMKVLAKKDGVL